jgi:hypothetical protein
VILMTGKVISSLKSPRLSMRDLRAETEFVTWYPIILPSRQRFHSAKKMIHSDQHESPTTLPEFIYWKEVYLRASMVQSSSRGASFLLGPQRQNVGLVPTVNHGRKDSLRQDH